MELSPALALLELTVQQSRQALLNVHTHRIGSPTKEDAHGPGAPDSPYLPALSPYLCFESCVFLLGPQAAPISSGSEHSPQACHDVAVDLSPFSAFSEKGHEPHHRYQHLEHASKALC